MRYKLVHGKGPGNTGSMGLDIFTEEDVRPSMKARGYKHIGENHNNYNCEELQGQPIFQGLAGPMWDGEGWIRYETPEMNDILSR